MTIRWTEVLGMKAKVERTCTVKAYMGWQRGWVAVKVFGNPADADDYIIIIAAYEK